MEADRRREWLRFLALAGVLAALYFLPVGNARFDGAVLEALALSSEYAREHVVLCLLPAFWISGAIAVFVSKGAVMRYLGPAARRTVAYGVAAVSGTILAVCSCTVLPLFSGIYRMGAGLGPATAFLYSGPAINVLAIVMTAKVLGFELGVARAVAAVLFSVVLGLSMGWCFRREAPEGGVAATALPDAPGRPLRQTALLLLALVAVLVFANWGDPKTSDGFFATVYAVKWRVGGASLRWRPRCCCARSLRPS